jgi:hypothetical protein
MCPSPEAIARGLKAPAPIEHSDATLRGHLETAAVIEAEGAIGHRHPVLQSFYRRFHLLSLEGGAPVRNLHARCYLLAEDVITFFVVLSLETGLEPECVKLYSLRSPGRVLRLGPSGDDPACAHIEPLAGGTRSRVPPTGGAMLTLLRVPF